MENSCRVWNFFATSRMKKHNQKRGVKMRLVYEQPQIQITEVDFKDILTASGDDENQGEWT
jgi:hypothetical protein